MVICSLLSMCVAEGQIHVGYGAKVKSVSEQNAILT